MIHSVTKYLQLKVIFFMGCQRCWCFFSNFFFHALFSACCALYLYSCLRCIRVRKNLEGTGHFHNVTLCPPVSHDCFLWFDWLLFCWLTCAGTLRFFSVQFTDYEVVARGYGGLGVRLDRTNEDKMKDVLKQALEDYRKGNSVLVNVLIGKTDFREGSISV